MSAIGLAARLGITELEAADLLQLHRRTYPQFWRWVEAASNYAYFYGHIETVYGWRLRVHDGTGPRTVQNMPMQATGAEILRLACSMVIDAGIRVCAPVHDAILIEAPENEIYGAAETARRLMVGASEIVLGGFPIRVEVDQVIRHPDRLITKKGRPMWDRVQRILHEVACGK